MAPVLFGLIAGIVFGLIAVAAMIPLGFADKTAAMLAAFASRFAIGFLIPLVSLPLPAVASGGLVGLLVSLPDALATKTYRPILGMGLVGGGLIGWLAQRVVA